MHKSTVTGRLIKLAKASEVVFIITKYERLFNIIRPYIVHAFVKKGKRI